MFINCLKFSYWIYSGQTCFQAMTCFYEKNENNPIFDINQDVFSLSSDSKAIEFLPLAKRWSFSFIWSFRKLLFIIQNHSTCDLLQHFSFHTFIISIYSAWEKDIKHLIGSYLAISIALFFLYEWNVCKQNVFDIWSRQSAVQCTLFYINAKID